MTLKADLRAMADAQRVLAELGYLADENPRLAIELRTAKGILERELAAALKAKEEAAAALEAVRADKMQWVDQATKDHDILYSAGIVEIAARNPSVAEYCKHWEERAEGAEERLLAFYRIFAKANQPLPPEFRKVMDDNFWELLKFPSTQGRPPAGEWP